MKQIRLENLNIWIKLLKKIYGLVFISIWAWFLYQCFLIYTKNKDFFVRIINLDFLEDKTMIDPLIALGINCAKLLGILIAALIIYSIVKKIFRAIPLPTSLINKWNNTNQISPMLAHRLISYYTYNTKLSFYDLLNIYNASQIEASILSYNFNNKNLEGLFKRFNPQLVGEIMIYNNYFPHMSLWQKIKTFVTGKPFRKPVLTENISIEKENIEDLSVNNEIIHSANEQTSFDTSNNQQEDKKEPSLELLDITSLQDAHNINSDIDKPIIDKEEFDNNKITENNKNIANDNNVIEKKNTNPFLQKPLEK